MISLPKVVAKRKKRVGRGRGSGKGGHTVGRGQKGQKSRAKLNVIFEGYKVRKSLFKRLPLQRGKGKFKANAKPVVVEVSLLNLLPDKSEVTRELLVKHNIVSKAAAEKYGVKILGSSELKKKLDVNVPVSKSAAKSIEKAGGKVIYQVVAASEKKSK